MNTWAAVLQRVPGSRFLLKGPAGGDPVIQRRLLERFLSRGIAAERVRVEAWLPKADHWRLYNEIDLALDTFPYNGGLTILEALWMGVPTVTVSGDTFVSRTGLAILHHVGLHHFVAETPTAMIDKAIALTARPDVLAKLRRNLRSALMASGLCDASRLARELEAAYRRMWQTWCAQGGRRMGR
jgi:predicted O-linked N-acetylglucosamine transferase (SPINDLY family)